MVPVCVILSLAFGFGKAVEAVGFANFIVSATEGLLHRKASARRGVSDLLRGLLRNWQPLSAPVSS